VTPIRASAEFAALAACCRWPRDPAAVREAVQEIDWEHFLALAQRHRVVGIAAAALEEASVVPPPAIALMLDSDRRRIARRNLRLLNETARLARLLADRGIAAAFVKGTTLAELAWHDQGFKTATDIDLAVAPDDLAAVIALLVEEGYRLDSPKMDVCGRGLAVLRDVLKEAAFVHDARRVMVDLHWRLASIPHLLPDVDPARDLADVLVEGRPIPTLRGGRLLDYLAVHGARHGWSRIKWLADFNALLAGMGGEEVALWYRRAVGAGIGPCAGLALWQSARIFAASVPPDILAEIARSRRVRWLAARGDALIVGDDELAEQPDRPLRYMTYTQLGAFMMGGGWRYQLACVAHAWVAPRDALALPLPRPLRPLYAIISPAMRLGRGFAKLGRALAAKTGFSRTAAGPMRARQ